MKLIWVLIFFLVGCGRIGGELGDDLTGQFFGSSEKHDLIVDPVLQPFVDEFFEMSRKHGIHHPEAMVANVTSSHLGRDKGGLCWHYSGGGVGEPYLNMVEIARWIIEEESIDQTRYVVFHELGHCVLGLDHTPRAKHIMNPWMQDTSAPWFSWEMVEQQLFSRTTSALWAMPGAAF